MRCTSIGILALLQQQQIERVLARLQAHRDRIRREVHGQNTDQRDDRADKQVQRQLHRRIFFARRTPDGNHDIHREDRQFVEEDQQEQVQRDEDAVDAGHQQHKERHEFADAILDVPRNDHAHHADDARQQHHHQADAVHADVITDAQRGHPRHQRLKLILGRRDRLSGRSVVQHERGNRQHQRDDRRGQCGDPHGHGALFRRQENNHCRRNRRKDNQRQDNLSKVEVHSSGLKCAARLTTDELR